MQWPASKCRHRVLAARQWLAGHDVAVGGSRPARVALYAIVALVALPACSDPENETGVTICEGTDIDVEFETAMSSCDAADGEGVRLALVHEPALSERGARLSYESMCELIQLPIDPGSTTGRDIDLALARDLNSSGVCPGNPSVIRVSD